MLNEKVVKVLQENTWSLATCDKEGMPNVVPMGFREVTADGKIAIGDVFMETTVANVLANPQAAVSAFDATSHEGYQVKGTAEYVTSGPIFDKFKVAADAHFKGEATIKGAVIITPTKVIVTTPGADNKKVL